MKRKTLIMLSTTLVLSGCIIPTNYSIVKSTLPLEVFDNDVMKNEYTGDSDKDAGVDKTRWLIIGLTVITLIPITIVTMSAKQRERQHTSNVYGY